MNTEKTTAYIDREIRTQWFRDARFGMFIHWGAYSVSGRGEWIRSAERLSVSDYQPYVERFHPRRCDMRQWAKLAKDAGMKYAVMTAKHHDGFCLFDSEETEYNTAKGVAGRDFIAEFVQAFRAEGLKVGIYYSLLDWHHPDYPAFEDRHHPMRQNPAYQKCEHSFERYVDYMHRQIRELCTNYGKIDIMWFDFSYDNYRGEMWGANEIVSMVRELQPEILIDNRLGGDMTQIDPSAYSGDFHGPEQCIPREPLTNIQGLPIPWELCTTMTNSWGYSFMDRQYKSAKFIINILVNCVSKGGNLILNVGPSAEGEIDEGFTSILRQVGRWLEKNADSIYGCGMSEFAKPEWGRFTQNGKTLYAHLSEQVLGHISLQGLKDRVKSARLLADGTEVILTGFWNPVVDTFDEPDDIFFNFAYPVHNTYALPDPLDTVVALELRGDDFVV